MKRKGHLFSWMEQGCVSFIVERKGVGNNFYQL